jgi:hypothetical protein
MALAAASTALVVVVSAVPVSRDGEESQKEQQFDRILD